jgi:hypothetical protein
VREFGGIANSGRVYGPERLAGLGGDAAGVVGARGLVEGERRGTSCSC